MLMMAGPADFPTTRWSLAAGANDPDRPDCCLALESLCEAYRYPLALFTLPDGRTGLVHCPEHYNQLEIEVARTGERLAGGGDRDPDDFFHSRLADAAIPLAEPGIKAFSPIPRIGAAGELKGVAVFLAADASNYITGQVIVVDGGRSIA